jgi:hypothetical protein
MPPGSRPKKVRSGSPAQKKPRFCHHPAFLGFFSSASGEEEVTTGAVAIAARSVRARRSAGVSSPVSSSSAASSDVCSGPPQRPVRLGRFRRLFQGRIRQSQLLRRLLPPQPRQRLSVPWCGAACGPASFRLRFCQPQPQLLPQMRLSARLPRLQGRCGARL